MKNFVLKHTFKNVLKWKENVNNTSAKEEHFGTKWKLEAHRKSDNFACFVYCMEPFETKRKSIDVEFELKVKTKNNEFVTQCSKRVFDKVEGWGWKKLIEWEDLRENYLVDGNLTVECHFQIKKYVGVYKDNLRSFDETMEEFSDVVLVVNGQKFYVLSKFLAAHSPYFKAMFMGNFNESSQLEIKLSGIDADDFQNFLEVLYGEPAIDDYTVEGIFVLSDMYDTQTVMNKCETFLLKESKKTLKKKLELAVRYNLNQLMKDCLSHVNSFDDVRSVIPGDIRDMDPSLTTALLEKSLSFE
uniref:BTB domain-containing protein n=1 Tax=Caenorhabditis tropicalis TaxID=1561998 RepID=A0A1I7ULJ5_9PELO